MAVKIYASEVRLREQAQLKGARYEPKTRLWHMLESDARELGLVDRIARHEEQV